MLQQVGWRNRKCSKLGNVFLLLKCSQGVVSLNPTQEFNSNHWNLTKRGWGGLLKCSQGLEMAQEWNRSSTPERVRSWGINTPLSKTSRCSVSVRPVRPVYLNTSRWPSGHLRPVPGGFWKLGVFSRAFLTWDCFEHFWCLSKPTDVASLLIVRQTYTQVHKWNIQLSQSSLWASHYDHANSSSINTVRASTSSILWAYPLWASDFESSIT